jgi:FixJ family two-component response regulator
MHEPLAVRASTKRLLTEDLVFVVDDDDAVRKDLEQLLGSVDLKVMPFRSGGEFLAFAIPDCPCCLVVEFCMPEWNGLQFQDQLAKAAFQIPSSLRGRRVSEWRFEP